MGGDRSVYEHLMWRIPSIASPYRALPGTENLPYGLANTRIAFSL